MTKKPKKHPLTVTELTLRLSEEARNKIIEDLPNMIGKEVEIEISHYLGGSLGKLICEVKSWEYGQKTQPKV